MLKLEYCPLCPLFLIIIEFVALQSRARLADLGCVGAMATGEKTRVELASDGKTHRRQINAPFIFYALT